MSSQFVFGIFGGDLRQVYIAHSLLSKGYRVVTYYTAEPVNHKNCSNMPTLSELFNQANILIGPIPMSRDLVTITAKIAPNDLTLAHVAYLLTNEHILFAGVIPSFITELCKEKKINYYDFNDNDEVAIKNAIATAEGTIMEAIASSDRNLHGSNCLVYGYGRCAMVLAAKLKALDTRVTIAARSNTALAYAEAAGMNAVHISNIKCILPSYQYIFNTIPSPVLDKDALELVDPHVTIIDIASAPGGVDFTYTQEHHINAKLCLGLPGKVAPRTSADILVTEILTRIIERSD